jgi:hypothetical protein
MAAKFSSETLVDVIFQKTDIFQNSIFTVAHHGQKYLDPVEKLSQFRV